MARSPQLRAPRAPSISPKVPRAAVTRRPQLEFKTARAPDPLAGAKKQDAPLPEQMEEIVTLAQEGYRAAEKQQREKYEFFNSVGYFRVLVWDDPAQAEAFLRHVGIETDQQYVDGRAVCDRLGIQIPETRFKPKAAKPNPRLAALALPSAKE